MSSENTRKRFGDVASFSRGLTFAKGDVATETTKCVLRSNNIDLTSHSLDLEDVACLKEEFVIPDDKKLHQGDIFICMSNGSTQHLGKVAFIDEDMDYAFGGFMGAIHPDRSIVFPKYAFYACLSAEYRHFLSSVFNGININNLKWSDLSRFTFPVPPIPEQERIVAELELLSGIIDKYKQQLKELDTLAQSIFYAMFGDPEENEKGWQMLRMEEVCCSMTKGPFGSDIKKSLYVPKTDEAYKVYIQANAIEKDLSLGDYYISKEYFDNKMSRFEVRPDDYIITCDGTLGKFIRLPKTIEKGIISASLLRLTLNDFILPEFFEHLWGGYILNILVKDIRNTALLHLPAASKIGKVLIPLPPLSLQQSFAEKMQAIEAQKENVKQAIKETETLFNSRMDFYFN